MAEELFLQQVHSAYAVPPIVRFRHLAKTKPNAEIVRRHEEGETLAALARDFDISEQRAWHIIRRYG